MPPSPVFSNDGSSGGIQMLIITRKTEEKIIVADNIEVTILEVGYDRVRFGITAPRNVIIQYRDKQTPQIEEAVEAAMPETAERGIAAGVRA